MRVQFWLNVNIENAIRRLRPTCTCCCVMVQTDIRTHTVINIKSFRISIFKQIKLKKFNVQEAYVGPCQLSMMDLFAKIIKEFYSFTVSAKTISSSRIFDRVLNKPLCTLSNSLILENCFILSFSIMICPFHMRARSRKLEHLYNR